MKPLPLCIALCLLLAACALDRPPTGGPTDTEPLQVLSVDPPASSVNSSPETVHFSFNRYVSTSSLRNSLVFSPAIPDYSLKADGKEAEIRFNTSLGENKTYTITLNKSLRSSRGNELRQSYSYAFSTGPEINRGIIAGQVFSHDTRPQPGATVLAYVVSENDTLPNDMLNRVADYSIQTGRNGAFTLDYLAEGNYRLIALLDKNSDKRLDPENEPFGAGNRKLVRTGSADNLFRLSQPESPPKLIYCTSPADNLFEISFNRPLSVDTFTLNALSVTDTVRNVTLPVQGFYSVKNTGESMTFRVVTGPLDRKSVYRVTYLTDNEEPASSALCSGSDKPAKDALAVEKLLPKNGETAAFLVQSRPDRRRTIDIAFNQPVAMQSLEQSIKLYAMNGETPSLHAFTLEPVDDRRYSVQADPDFRNGASYRLDIEQKSITPLTGLQAADSLVTTLFTVANAGDFGSISGTVTGGTGTVVVEALETAGRLPRKTVIRREDGRRASFTIDALAPGKYTLRAFIPRSGIQTDNNISWNPGSVSPFRPADRFTVNPDTVTVRKGWATENIPLVFPPASE
ncbi:MAG: hypothetical protein C1941_03490 [Prosthecochloris sp.]|nr:hypothetical protein [Prosthecochloris sp.]